MATDALYPPAPADVPADITRLDGAYRLRVAAMIGGLFLFLLLYMLFIAAAGLLAYGLIVMPLPSSGGRGIIVLLILKFGGAFAALLLWLFLLKGLFKGRRVERSTYLALQEGDHPELFAFIRRVYQDVGAPPPCRVYVSPDVNAALVYDTSLINLVLPPRKDLLIGVGLVNVVTLAEFKAVLAHEFGHFAQRSSGLGTYLYVANQVMADVIYSRDGLDRFVDAWSAQDVRISFPAWALKGVLWLVRKVLSGTFQGLNLLHLSLSRQLEYNADNVAVRVTGSDALIHGLSRLAFATECLGDAARSLDAAADHDLFSDDLFYHQAQSALRLRRLRNDERAGVPPDLPDDVKQSPQVFAAIDDGIPERYRTHPTDHMRERNAKRFYVRSPRDDRSPWLLFGDAARVRRQVTEQFYRHALGRKEKYAPRPAAEVQQFIDAEHAETTYDPRYQGLYDDRFIDPGELSSLPGQPWPAAEIDPWLAAWPPADLAERVKAWRDRQAEFNLLNGLRNGALSLKGKTFTFRDRQHTSADVERLLGQVNGELDADHAAFGQLDRSVLLAHWSLARHLDRRDGGRTVRESDLLERYRFHKKLQTRLQTLLGEQAHLNAIFNFLAGNPQLPEADFREVCNTLKGIHRTLKDNLSDARGETVPALTNVPAGSSLHALIVDRGDTALPPLEGDGITGEWLGKLATRVDGVLNRLKRVHFKSLGSLLALQEKLAAEWQSAQAAPAEQTAFQAERP